MEAAYKSITEGRIDDAASRLLSGDPWCADLTYDIAAFYFFRREQNNAVQWATRFVQIAPNSKFIQRTP